MTAMTAKAWNAEREAKTLEDLRALLDEQDMITCGDLRRLGILVADTFHDEVLLASHNISIESVLLRPTNTRHDFVILPDFVRPWAMHQIRNMPASIKDDASVAETEASLRREIARLKRELKRLKKEAP